jgi:hypothetical protein
MRTVENRFPRISAAANPRLQTAKNTDSRGKRVSGIASADLEIADALANDDPTFIYAIAARAKHAIPTVITVQTVNGLALQMLKS